MTVNFKKYKIKNLMELILLIQLYKTINLKLELKSIIKHVRWVHLHNNITIFQYSLALCCLRVET